MKTEAYAQYSFLCVASLNILSRQTSRPAVRKSYKLGDFTRRLENSAGEYLKLAEEVAAHFDHGSGGRNIDAKASASKAQHLVQAR